MINIHYYIIFYYLLEIQLMQNAPKKYFAKYAEPIQKATGCQYYIQNISPFFFIHLAHQLVQKSISTSVLLISCLSLL